MQIANLERWNPVEDINQLPEGLSWIFGNDGNRVHSKFYPKYDIWEIDEGIILTTELPGLDKGDIDISIEGNLLLIRGNKKAPVLKDRELLILREHLYGEFSRSIKLPYRVNPDLVEAKFRNGVLTIKLVRPEEDKLKKVQIQAE